MHEYYIILLQHANFMKMKIYLSLFIHIIYYGIIIYNLFMIIVYF